jgi:hypothetical protein
LATSGSPLRKYFGKTHSGAQVETSQHIFEYRKAAEENIPLKNPGYSSSGSAVRRKFRYVLALKDYFTPRGVKGAPDHIEDSGLAGTIRPDKSKYLSPPDI